MWCANCGNELPENASFCGTCSAQVAGTELRDFCRTQWGNGCNGAGDDADEGEERISADSGTFQILY